MSKEPKVFKYGTLLQECGCGEIITTAYTNVEGGIQIILPTHDSRNVFKLVCPKCKNSIELYFIEAEGPKEEPAQEDVVKEETIDEEGTKEDNKE